MSDFVTIVIPAYNAASTINAAIDSVLAQSHGDLELIVCDDASIDNTEALVQAQSDPRIHLICNASNLGEGASRDRAIAEARGRWIAVLDADDAWHPQRLEIMLQAAGGASNVMVFDDIMECHHTPKGLRPWRPIRGERAFGAGPDRCVDVSTADWIRSKRLLIKPLMPAAAIRSLQAKHSDRRFSADTEYFLRLLAGGIKLRYLPQALYLYRITPGSMSSLRTRDQLMADTLREAMPAFSGQADVLEALMAKIAMTEQQSFYQDFSIALKERSFSRALRAFRTCPRVVPSLLVRAVAEVPYHVHRLFHQGARRA